MILQIVADRFGVTSDGRAIDLATGATVVLKIGAGGGPAEQTRWSLQCDGLQKLHGPRVATLVDYGPLGETQRFEAWHCASTRHGPPENVATALDALGRSALETVAPE